MRHDLRRVVHGDCARVIALAARAADRDGDLRGIGSQCQRACHGETTGTSAATDALGEDSIRIRAGSFNHAGVGNKHDTGHAAGGGVAAHR